MSHINFSKKVKLKIGKHVRSAQRNFPYPIKSLIKSAPPIETSKDGVRLVIIAQNKTFIESLWTAYTWIYYSETKLSLLLLINGSLCQKQKNIFLKLFPQGEIGFIDDYIDSDILANEGIRRFHENHKFGKILTLKLSVQRHESILFSDPDVLVFQRPTEILSNIQKNRPCYFAESKAVSISSWVKNKAKKLSLNLTEDFNSGVLYIPKNSLSVNTCSVVLDDWNSSITDYFPEQTICDVLMTQSGAESLPTDEYIVNNKGMWYWEKDADYERIKVRHFVGNVRHRMYMSGYPILREKLRLFS